jgi:hypothetical protein
MKNNFDFLVGEWTSTQRRLREVLNGCDEWDEFPGFTKCWSLLDGACNVDEVTFPTRGFSGVTLRLYDKGNRRVVALLGQQPHRQARAAAPGRALRRERARRVLRRRCLQWTVD